MSFPSPDPRRPAEPAEQRASDADRDRVAAVLGEALATGRLTSVEHADRLEAAYKAVTIGDLLPLTRDLPGLPAAAAPSPREGHQVAAVFSKVIRKGRWVPGRHTRLRSLFGALIVDLSEAVLPGREVVLDVSATFGKVIVRIPGNARVLDEGGALFSKRQISGGDATGGGPDAPLIRVTGNAVFGKIVVARGGEILHWYW